MNPSTPASPHSDPSPGTDSTFTIKELPADLRPRERLLHAGPRALNNAELLAIVLRTGRPGENVVHLAQRLLTTFGGLGGLVRATTEELCQVPGLGQAKATQVKAALELGRRLLVEAPRERPTITTPEDAANLVLADMGWLEHEELRVMLLDTRNRVQRVLTLYQGNVNTTVVRIGEIFRAAVRDNSSGLILVHNHPSGDPSPSPEDVRITAKVVEAGALLGIQVLDHLVIGRNRFVSLKEQGLGFP